jgi:hypothetical protein
LAASTQTPNYGWTQPAVGGDPTTWGTEINNVLALIDAQVSANEQGVPLIGSILMWGGGMTPPINWILCDGSSYATTGTYAKLFAAIGYAWGGSGATFNVPNLENIFPLGASATNTPASKGGSFSYTISANQMPAHAHGVSDPQHTHGAYQSAHAHVIYTGNHAHGITTGSHVHGGVVTGLGGPGPIAGGAGATLAVGNTAVAGNLGGNTDTAGNLGGNTDTQAPGVGVNAAATGIGIQNAGGGAPITIVPTYVAVPYIIRFQ